ncbi:Transducin-like enhancer protein 4 [Chamberlinius hualienensis]
MCNTLERVFTGGKGCVKVWDVNSSSGPLYVWPLLEKSKALTRVRFTLDRNALIAVAETGTVTMWEFTPGSSKEMYECAIPTAICYDIVVCPVTGVYYGCCIEGSILGWDGREKITYKAVAELKGHTRSPLCMAISSDGKTLWTGGLDRKLFVWDLRMTKCISEYTYRSAITSISCRSGDELVIVGLENGDVEIFCDKTNDRFIEKKQHQRKVTSVNLARSGKWYLSTSVDRRMSFKSEVLSCEIADDDKTVAIGTNNQLHLFNVVNA